MPTTNQPHILQIFTGRLIESSVVNHPGLVFKQMFKFPWEKWRDEWSVSHIYLTGIFDTGYQVSVNFEEGIDLQSKQHRLPSPFAIINHHHINPVLGTVGDFIELTKSLHRRGLKVVIDFVPNHTSIFHPWVKQHPDWYYYQNNQLVTEFSHDVAKLNYQNPDCFTAMSSLFKYLTTMPIDGIRVDMAHFVPIKFWQTVLASKHSSQIYLAEAYADSPFNLSPLETLIDAGFDYVYDEISYRNIQSGNQLGLLNHLEYLNTTKYAPNYLHYLSNHDQSLACNQEQIQTYEDIFGRFPGGLLSFLPTKNGRSHRQAHHFFDPVSVLSTS